MINCFIQGYTEYKETDIQAQYFQQVSLCWDWAANCINLLLLIFYWSFDLLWRDINYSLIHLICNFHVHVLVAVSCIVLLKKYTLSRHTIAIVLWKSFRRNLILQIQVYLPRSLRTFIMPGCTQQSKRLNPNAGNFGF